MIDLLRLSTICSDDSNTAHPGPVPVAIDLFRSSTIYTDYSYTSAHAPFHPAHCRFCIIPNYRTSMFFIRVVHVTARSIGNSTGLRRQQRSRFL
jgi:hypothetical protein